MVVVLEERTFPFFHFLLVRNGAHLDKLSLPSRSDAPPFLLALQVYARSLKCPIVTNVEDNVFLECIDKTQRRTLNRKSLEAIFSNNNALIIQQYYHMYRLLDQLEEYYYAHTHTHTLSPTLIAELVESQSPSSIWHRLFREITCHIDRRVCSLLTRVSVVRRVLAEECSFVE